MKEMKVTSTQKISVSKIITELAEYEWIVQSTLNVAGELDKMRSVQISSLRVPQLQASLSRTTAKAEETWTLKKANCIPA